MGKTLAIIHTTPVTIETLKHIAEEMLPDVKVINIMDDSILPQLAKNEGKIEDVEERLLQYTKYAQQVGADIILNACSSVGEVVAKAREQLSIPIIRIDEAMAEEAVKRSNEIGVIATLPTTLNPTIQLLQDTARKLNRQVEIQSELAEEAYKRLMKGDSQGHNEILADALVKLSEKTDVVVLAQASMARVVATLPADLRKKFLTSPKLGMEKVKQTLEGML